MSSKQATDEISGGIELIANYECEIGENPLWHSIEKRLYWCDIGTGRIFRYDPATGAHEQCYQGRTVGGFTIQSDGSLLLFMDRGTIASWGDGHVTEFVTDIPAERSSRFNDVIADPMGRVFCGTMSTNEGKGRLYRFDTDRSLHVVLENIGCSNGMAFTPDRKGFFYTDSFAGEIYLFDYDAAEGSLSNRTTFATFDKSNGLPDGITVDASGALWVALWDGGCVVSLDRYGQICRTIELPASQVSSVTFGGDDYSHLYVTTAGGSRRRVNAGRSGALFRVNRDIRGVPEFPSRICLSK